MRRLFSLVMLVLAVVVASPAPSFAAGLPTFTTETEAQKHCPADTVVWLNLPTGVYHLKSQRWYGATKNGAFVCRKEADQAGDRVTHNGQ